jgi:hypothetical protein
LDLIVLRILRAFIWMRWRVFMNSLERTGARDTLERLSLAVEQVGPLIALALLIPTMGALAVLGGYAGYWLASGAPVVMTFEALVFLLVSACLAAIVGPLLVHSAERNSAVRLLLLPISRATLYIAQAAGTLSDPWILLALPVVLSIPVGLAAGGAPAAALVALVAGLLLTAVLTGFSALASLVLQFVVRDRRRAELAALFFIVIAPMFALLPALLDHDRENERRGPASAETREQARDRRRGDPIPGWLQQTASRVYRFVPAEQFAAATRVASRGDLRRTLSPLLGLIGFAVVLHSLGFWTLGRLLDSPFSSGRRYVGSTTHGVSRRIPGLSPASAAVALAQVRLVMRTPRGRSTLLSPLIVFVMFAIMMGRSGDMDFGPLSLDSGLGLATFGCAVSLLSILPFAVNQLAIDGAGLTLAFLAPLDDRQLLAGKAAGNAIVVIAPATILTIAAYVLFPGGSPALWISLLLGVLGTYVLAAPAVAALSIIFPRAVDLNSISRGSNAHGVANLLGMLALVVAAAPPVLLALVVTTFLGRPTLAPLLLAAWCGIALALGRFFLGIATNLLDDRRENLALVA